MQRPCCSLLIFCANDTMHLYYVHTVTRNEISKHTFLIYLHELITQSKNLTKRIVYIL